MNEQVQFYFCYNPILASKMKDAKQRLITVAISPNTGKKFWLYQRTPELTKVLDEFSMNK